MTEGENSDQLRAQPPTRLPLFEVYMRMVEELAKRSTCQRLSVGTVIGDAALQNVVAIGYNGNARGFPNDCDTTTPGACGCIRSEMNALVKAPGALKNKVAFITASRCTMCAKLMIQARVSHLYYRSPEGIEVLRRGGIVAVQYDRWQDRWRTSATSGNAVASSHPDGVDQQQSEQERLID